MPIPAEGLSMMKLQDYGAHESKYSLRQETIEYIAEMIMSLNKIALQNNLSKLSLLLDLAYDEAVQKWGETPVGARADKADSGSS